MYKCAVEHNSVYQDLTQNESEWQIVSITGLNPPPAQINISPVVGLDGGKFNSSKLETRNIVITLKLNNDVERNRLYLYSLFPTKEEVRFFYSNENRDVFIVARVETVECAYFDQQEIMQISLICPQPYFRAIDETESDISKVTDLFTFPFSIETPIPISSLDTEQVTDIVNEGESETGMIIDITFSAPVETLRIQNTETGEYLELSYHFWANDEVIVNTNKGEKSVRLIREGMEFNLFSSVVRGSTFFSLSSGDNLFSYTADDGETDDDVHIVFRHYSTYRGV